MKYFILVAFALTHSFSKGQNTFPSTGNVGINLGSSTSSNKLQLGPNLQNWSGNDLVVSNSTGSIAIHNQAGESYIYGTQTISLRPGFGQPALYAISNGSIGIGTSTPQKRLEVLSSVNDFVSIGSTLSIGQYSGLHFGYLETGNTNYRKSAIVFERVDNAANGKIHILNNGVGNQSASLADSRLTIDYNGNLGIGTTSPTTRLDIYEVGGGSGQFSALRIRNGNSSNYFGNNQVLLSYAGGTGYSHTIKTRHNAGAISGNAVDFYVWKPGDAVEAVGSNLTMTLDGGNVGIGTSSPSNKLQVTGGDIGLDADQPLRGGGKWLISGNSSMVTVGTANPGVGLRFYAGADINRMIIDPATGNVGIGSQTPTQKLTVNGTIYGKEVKVDLSVPGPDYVFDEDYNLTPLEDIKTYIDQNKHLPEVPSAKEMEKNGIRLGEMNMLLLKKIEELTLHMIEQETKMKKMESEIQVLKNQK